MADAASTAAPASQCSADDAWGLKPPPVTPAADGLMSTSSTLRTPVNQIQFRELVVKYAEELMLKHHGPMQYLMQRYPTVEDKRTYMNKLWKLIPPLPEKKYEFLVDIPAGQNDTMNIHIACLNFDPAHSPREPTRSNTCLELLDNILTDGFVTDRDPLIVCTGGPEKIRARGNVASEMPWAEGSAAALPAFSVALQKGSARVATLHLVLSICLDDEVDLQQVAPAVWHSMRCLQFYNVAFSTLREQTFNNFKLSARGAIRKPPNVVSWVIMLTRMATAGDKDVGTILRTWNRESAKVVKFLELFLFKKILSVRRSTIIFIVVALLLRANKWI